MKKMYNSLRLLLILLVGSHMGAIAQTFTTVGSNFYTVPAGVTGITVNVKGAAGGLNSDEITYDNRKGYGGCTQAYIIVTPGQVLNINIGGCGGNGTTSAGGAGGFNGGGNGGHNVSILSGGGGGGASDIRVAPYSTSDRLVVAGGGGGAAINCGGDLERGGDGGYTLGFPLPIGGEAGRACGVAVGGSGGLMGGSSAAGGTCTACGGTAGLPGDNFSGGDAGNLSAGGGGGGGFGAGGGGQWTGGGGGADYYGGAGVSLLSETRGCNTGCGSVTVSVSCIVGTISGANQVCPGVTNPPLTATVSGGTWSSSSPSVGSISATGAVTGVSAGGGPITITYSLTTYCYTTFPMTVNPSPAPITGIATLCQNQPAPFSDATSGGTWSSTATSIATVNSTSGLVTPVSGPGTTNIIYTITATGCTASFALSINPVPAAIVGADTVCVGGCTTLTDATPSGSWSSSSPLIASVSGGGLVCGLVAGTTTIGYTLIATGCAATMVVTVRPLPAAIGGPSHICMGTTTNETNTSLGGTWTVSPGTGDASINPSTGLVTPISVGTINITYTLPSTCYVTRVATVEAAVPAITTLTSGVVCIGSTILLSDAGTGGLWGTSNSLVATVAGGTVSGVGLPGSGGTAIINYTIGFCAATFTVTVNPRPTAIGGANEVCVGDCSQVYTSGPSAGTWASSSPAIGTIDPTTGTFCAISAGTTTLVYTLASTGCTNSKVVTVNPLPVPITAFPAAHVCVGSTTTLSEPVSGTWFASNTDIALSTLSGTSTVCTPVDTSGADITFTDGNGCSISLFVRVDTAPGPISILSGTNPICAGLTVTLQSVGSPAGTWTSGLTAVATIVSGTGVATGVAGGIANITFRVTGTGCESYYSLQVNSQPNPITPSPINICQGDVISVGSGGGSGNWSSTNTAIATVVDFGGLGAGTLTGVSPGLDTICYTFVPGGGSCVRCTTVNVVAPPAPIGGPNSVCAGSSITLTDATIGGTWASVNTTKATVTAGGVVTALATVVATTTDTITYTVGTCQVEKVITINPTPAALTTTGSVNICQGLTTTLCTTGPGGFGYSWTSGTTSVGTIVAAGLCATVTGVSAGTTTISYGSGFTGCYATRVVTVTSSLPPIIGPNYICMGTTAVESNAGTGNWNSSATTIASTTFPAPGPTSTSTTITPITTGTFTLTFSSPTGCTSTKVMSVNLTPTAIITPLSTTNLCPGGFVDLTATSGTGFTYQWYNPGAIAGATSGTYLANAAGTYFVTVSAPGPCNTTSAGTVVTMNPVNPTITPSLGIGVPLCASAGLTLTASAATTYQWQLGGVAIAGATNAVFTPSVTGSYTVMETNGFSCTGTSPATSITLVSAPTGVVTITGTLSFCAGGNVILTGDAGTGYTYQWYNGAAAIAGATNISYVATTAGTYHVVESNPTGCTTTSANSVVVVKPLPTATITTGSSPVFCTGGSVALAALPIAGNLFQWYKDGSPIIGATNSTYVTGVTGNYTVKVDSPASGCSAISPVKVVTQVTAPTITLVTPSSFCWGSSATLAAMVVGGAGTVGYQWTFGGVNIPGATNSTYAAMATGNYAVTISVGGGICTTTSGATAVTEYPLPNPLITDTGGTHIYTQSYFVSYQWFLNLIPIPGATTSNIPKMGNGSYKVQVTDTNRCQSMSAGVIVSDWVSNGVVNVTNPGANIRIYPNPASNAIMIDAPVAVRAVISSIDGRTVLEQSAATTIDISKLANGIYTIKVYDATGIMLKVDKLVKESN